MGVMVGAVASYLDALARGFLSEIRAGLSEHVVIDDPRAGRVAGTIPVERFLVDAHAWLHQARARVAPVRVTAAGRLAVAESLVELDGRSGRAEMPAAVVGETAGEGEVVALRVYHGFWTLEGRHRVRPPLLPARRTALPPVVEAYQRALARGDVEGVLAQFEEQGCAREPAGGAHVHRGPQALRRFYAALLARGGIPLQHCSAVDDGVACAVEYNVVRWGRTELPPQAGVAVYERGPSGRLAAARIYDDVDPPTHG